MSVKNSIGSFIKTLKLWKVQPSSIALHDVSALLEFKERKFRCLQAKITQNNIFKIMTNAHFHFMANNVLGDFLRVFYMLCFAYHIKPECLSTPQTQNIIRNAIFGQTGTPQQVNAWPCYGSICKKTSFFKNTTYICSDQKLNQESTTLPC